MAKVVPTKEHLDLINSIATESELNLMHTLSQVLDDSWVVFLKPHLNALSPSVVVFSENSGIGIFNVFDQNVKSFPIATRHHPENPIQRVRDIKYAILNYEVLTFASHGVLDDIVENSVLKFIYFPANSTYELRKEVFHLMQEDEFYLGYDVLSSKGLISNFAIEKLIAPCGCNDFYTQNNIENSLRNALGYRENKKSLLERKLHVPLSPKQERLLKNETGQSKRVLGVAGSGKTILIVHKAVEAAKSGLRVLVVCFNITMANYLRDMIDLLARDAGFWVHRNIEVGHFHRMFPEEINVQGGRYCKRPIDVLLIDEGQDFKRQWIEDLLAACGRPQSERHFLLVEDDRQNIYSRQLLDVDSVSEITGRPTMLTESYRLNPTLVRAANMVLGEFSDDFESDEIRIPQRKKKDPTKNSDNKIEWIDGALEELSVQIAEKVKLMNLAQPEEVSVAILVFQISDGWPIQNMLKEQGIDYNSTFESREQHALLLEKHSEKNKKQLRAVVEAFRSKFKKSYFMVTNQITFSTVHSFKGWEYPNVIVLANPAAEQKTNDVDYELLYTAATRSQRNLSIFNTDADFREIGKKLRKAGLTK